MQLTFNGLQEYATSDGKRGVCRLWLLQGDGDLAVVVLTQLPGDPSPDSLEDALDTVAGRVCAERRLDAGRTLWFHRVVTRRGPAPPIERFAEVEFNVSQVKSLYDPRTTPSTRASVEIAARRVLPEIADDEINHTR